MKALEQTLVQQRARKQAKIKAQADAAKREAIETARRKVAEEKTTTEAELRTVKAEIARLQQQREQEAVRAHEEAEKPAAEETAAAMEEVERKIPRETPPGGSRVDILRRFFDGNPTSRRRGGLSEQRGQRPRHPSPLQGQWEDP